MEEATNLQIKSHKDLLIRQKSMNLVEKVYKATMELPNSEQYGLTNQLRRAAISVPSNIAEGFGRQATGEYRHHLAIARASLLELDTQITICKRLSYLSDDTASNICDDTEQISKMLVAIIRKLVR